MDYLNVNVFRGEQIRYQYLINWCNSNIQHVDFDDKHNLVYSYSTYGRLTGLGNLVPFAMSVVDTDYFRNDLFRKNSVSTLFGGKIQDINRGVIMYYSLMLQYCAIEENLDEQLKVFTKISTKQLRVNQRGSVVTYNDMAEKIRTSPTYCQDICRIIHSIRQHCTP